LPALASVADTTSLGELTARLGQPVKRHGRWARPLTPHAPDDAKLLGAIGRGEFTLNGFRNRDLRALLFADAGASPEQQRRNAAAVSRKLALLRAHGLIRKVTGTHRYHLSAQGRIIVTALTRLRGFAVRKRYFSAIGARYQSDIHADIMLRQLKTAVVKTLTIAE
jgi:hypothetical protein